MIASAVCLAVFSACGGSGAPREFTTKIRGTVIDRPDSKTLLLTRIYEDTRVAGIEIPIVEGRFEYDLTTDTREEWQLIFRDEMQQGSMRPAYFFSEPGTVTMTLYPMERYEENSLAGGRLNTEFAAFRDSMMMWGKIYREEGMKIVERGYRPRSVSMSTTAKRTLPKQPSSSPTPPLPRGLRCTRSGSHWRSVPCPAKRWSTSEATLR